MEVYIGEVHLFAFDFAPKNWLPCDGRILPINEYETLFTLLGNTYGGDGRTNFALPKLNDYYLQGGANFGPYQFLCYYIATEGLYPMRHIKEGRIKNMWNYYYGEILLLPYEFIPKDCLLCDGSLVSSRQYQALFALIGYTYGGNPINQLFNLPDLRGMEPAKGLKYCIVCYGMEYPVRP